VASGKNEAVSIGPVGISGIVVQKIVPERINHRGKTHGRAGVARIGLLDGIDGKSTNSVDTQLIEVRLAHNISEAGKVAPAI